MTKTILESAKNAYTAFRAAMLTQAGALPGTKRGYKKGFIDGYTQALLSQAPKVGVSATKVIDDSWVENDSDI
jgi:hypothetical protein